MLLICAHVNKLYVCPADVVDSVHLCIEFFKDLQDQYIFIAGMCR